MGVFRSQKRVKVRISNLAKMVWVERSGDGEQLVFRHQILVMQIRDQRGRQRQTEFAEEDVDEICLGSKCTLQCINYYA